MSFVDDLLWQIPVGQLAGVLGKGGLGDVLGGLLGRRPARLNAGRRPRRTAALRGPAGAR